MQLKAEPVSPDTLIDLKLAYLRTLCAPLDGMWESGFLPLSQHWAILYRDRMVGYYCVDSDKALLQFYLPDALALRAPAFLAGLISLGQVTSAYAGTNEPGFLALCLDRQKAVSVHTYLFSDGFQDAVHPESSDHPRLRLTDFSETERVVRFIERNTESRGGWVRGYLRRLIERGESYLMEADGRILGTGECRVSDSQPPYVDLGMIVDKKFRGQGVATAILLQMKALCHSRVQRPICSTTVENVAARKAIEKAGFIARHRILQIQF